MVGTSDRGTNELLMLIGVVFVCGCDNGMVLMSLTLGLIVVRCCLWVCSVVYVLGKSTLDVTIV